MRDDIHRRLPLPRVWKRVFKACSRDAEFGDRSNLVTQAAGRELQQLRPSVLDAGRRALAATEGVLFPGESSDREVGTYAVVDLDELAGVATQVPNLRGHVLETAKAVGRPSDEVETKVQRLFERHADEWRGFISALPARSWLRDVVNSGQGAGDLWTKQS